MKKYMLVVVLAVASLLSFNAQSQTVKVDGDVKIGDVFVIGESNATLYKHINFPRPNFIIKRGGIANYKALENDKVVVTSVKAKKDGSTVIKIKRADGKKFFRNYTQVSANFKEALESGELKTL